MEWILYIFIAYIVIKVIQKLAEPTSCDVCSTDIKRKYYTWTIDGKKQHLCPNCNSKMNRRQSNRHFKNRFG